MEDGGGWSGMFNGRECGGLADAHDVGGFSEERG
jgi:hypothetical protein